MQICLQPFLARLRKLGRERNVLTIAVLHRDVTINAVKPFNIQADTQPDGRMAYSTLSGDDVLADYFGSAGVVPEHWVEIRTYREYFAEHVTPDTVEGRYAEINTGMLNLWLGYIAVQAKWHTDILEELISLRAERSFDQLVPPRAGNDM